MIGVAFSICLMQGFARLQSRRARGSFGVFSVFLFINPTFLIPALLMLLIALRLSAGKIVFDISTSPEAAELKSEV